MFLRRLSNEQKGLFLELALKAAEANHVIEESEKVLLIAYADEMGIEPIEYSSTELLKIITDMKRISSQKELKQMMVEIVAMTMSDLSYDEEERKFIDNLSAQWGISQDTVEKMRDCVNEYMNIINKMNALIDLGN